MTDLKESKAAYITRLSSGSLRGSGVVSWDSDASSAVSIVMVMSMFFVRRIEKCELEADQQIA